MLAAANHHKPPPKRRKYAGFGTMGIPAIRESIVLHRQGLATLKEPNYLLLSQILAVVRGGLPAFRWFAWFPLFSLPIVPNSGGDLGWFALVCLIVIPLQTAHLLANTGVVERGVESTTGDLSVYPL